VGGRCAEVANEDDVGHVRKVVSLQSHVVNRDIELTVSYLIRDTRARSLLCIGKLGIKSSGTTDLAQQWLTCWDDSSVPQA